MRANLKWTPAIDHFVRSMCPAPEHGYKSRQEIVEAIYDWFGVEFSIHAFCSHCCERGIQLGFVDPAEGVNRGDAHWRHRPVGSFQRKKGYLRIKVAEPNEWMQYQRYVWETHTGQSAEGKTVIFMDGDNHNFDPSNLECVTRAELYVMTSLGNHRNATAEERRSYLLMARIILQQSKLVGSKKLTQIKAKARYERVKNTPEFKKHASEYAREYLAKIMADPVRYSRLLEKNRIRRRKSTGERK